MSTLAQPSLAHLSGRLSQLADRLDTYVSKYEVAKDSRAIFTFAYVKLTRTLAERLSLANFRHPEWGVLAERFAALLSGARSLGQ